MKKGRPRQSQRESGIVNPTAQPNPKRRALHHLQDSLISPRVSSHDIFNKDPIPTISGLLATRINGRRPDATNRPIPISYNQHSRLSDPQAVQVALNELDDDHETRERKQAKARNKQIERRPPSHHCISSSSDQLRQQKKIKPRGPSKRLSVENSLSADIRVAPPSAATIPSSIVPINQSLLPTPAHAPAPAPTPNVRPMDLVMAPPPSVTPPSSITVTSPIYTTVAPPAALPFPTPNLSKQAKYAERNAKSQERFRKRLLQQ